MEHKLPPEIKWMLTALLESCNDSCADHAQKILSGEWTIPLARIHEGSFMTAVIDGEVEHAFRLADTFNFNALARGIKIKPPVNLCCQVNGKYRCICGYLFCLNCIRATRCGMTSKGHHIMLDTEEFGF